MLSSLTQRSEEPASHLRKIAHELTHLYADKLKNIKTKMLVSIKISPTESLYFLISQEGIRELKEEAEIANRVFVSYKDFLRLLEKPDRALRYMMEGRIKLKGDVKDILDVFSRL